MTTVSRPEFEALKEQVSANLDFTKRHLDITDTVLKAVGLVDGLVDALESRVEGLGGRIGDIARRMTRLEEQSDNIQRGIVSIEQRMTRFEERIEELPSLIATKLATP